MGQNPIVLMISSNFRHNSVPTFINESESNPIFLPISEAFGIHLPGNLSDLLVVVI